MFGKDNPKRARNICLTVLGSVTVLFVIVMIGLQLYFSNRWSENAYINGMSVSGMTYEAAREQFQEYARNYTLHIIGRNHGEMYLDSDNIGLALDIDAAMQPIFEKNKKLFLFSKLCKQEYEVEFPVKYDRAKLESLVKSADMVTGENGYEIKKPKSAYVTYDEATGCGAIVKEELGNLILVPNLLNIIGDALEHMDAEINLEMEEQYASAYKQPKYFSEDQQLQTELKQYNTYLLNWIHWTSEEGIEETITPEQIKEWLTIKKNGTVKIQKKAMESWIEEFCLKYKTYGKTRKFTTHDNREIEVTGGDYGWRIDYEKVVKQTLQTIKEEEVQEDMDAYVQNPTEQNRAPLTTELEIPFSNKGYCYNPDDIMQDWNTQNYSEVDISDQMVYVYKDGKLAYSSICVTGLESDPERSTRTGCYFVKEKREDYVLVGEDYETPTKYWVRIMWTGTGYHYLGRSDWSRWSPSLYLTRGSHGCINLQLEDAKAIYDLVSYRDPVFIHK